MAMHLTCNQEIEGSNPSNGSGEMAEWTNAPVLKTGLLKDSGGSNPSLSAMLIKVIATITLLLSSILNSSIENKQRCDRLVHIGDSTTLSILPYLESDYKESGFSEVVINASNGRSIIYSGNTAPMNGLEAVRHYQEALGDNICWVMALGTNDSSAVSPKKMLERFKSMMFVIGGQKILWINVWTDSKTRPDYNTTDSRTWNYILMAQKQQYSNMEVFDWATIAKSHPEWFTSDGIHYNSEGSRQRSWWISRISSLILL